MPNSSVTFSEGFTLINDYDDVTIVIQDTKKDENGNSIHVIDSITLTADQ